MCDLHQTACADAVPNCLRSIASTGWSSGCTQVNCVLITVLPFPASSVAAISHHMQDNHGGLLHGLVSAASLRTREILCSRVVTPHPVAVRATRCCAALAVPHTTTDRFRTQMCNNGQECNRKVCFFAHRCVSCVQGCTHGA
jgi:hypothetical protein